MAIKRLTLVSIVGSLLGCSALAEMDFKTKSEIQLFRNYAQASCLATAFTEGDIHFQAIGAMSGYREHGSMPLEAYEGLVVPIQQWLQKDYESLSGEQNHLMKCVDFSLSSEVSELYQQFDPCLVAGPYGIAQQQRVFKCPSSSE